jgi:hypothetical protein
MCVKTIIHPLFTWFFLGVGQETGNHDAITLGGDKTGDKANLCHTHADIEFRQLCADNTLRDGHLFIAGRCG